MENCPGTVKTVMPILEELSKNLTLSSDSAGPMLKSTSGGKEVLLCFIDNTEYFDGYNNTRAVSRIWALDTRERTGLFKILTPKALEIVNTFIDQVANAFLEEYQKH